MEICIEDFLNIWFFALKGEILAHLKIKNERNKYKAVEWEWSHSSLITQS